MRELCFVTRVAGAYAAVVIFTTIQSLFCGMCLYIVAMYKELQNMLKCIDGNSREKIKRNLCDCIKYHLAILKYIVLISKLFFLFSIPLNYNTVSRKLSTASTAT